jgi:hypothetical protein
MGFHPVRSVAAILGGALLLGFMDSTLERTLVGVISQSMPADEAAYLAIRNRPLVLAISLVTHTLASLLCGYIVGRIAGGYEVKHGIAAGVLLAIGYASSFLSDNPMMPPAWVRIAMVLLTPPAIVAGAHVRAEARALRAEEAAAARPKEQS